MCVAAGLPRIEAHEPRVLARPVVGPFRPLQHCHRAVTVTGHIGTVACGVAAAKTSRIGGTAAIRGRHEERFLVRRHLGVEMLLEQQRRARECTCSVQYWCKHA